MRFSAATLLSVLFFAGQAHAIAEDNYQETFESQVLPWAGQYEINYLTGRDGAAIAWVCFEKPGARDAILVSAGRTENIPKYLELAYDLYHGRLKHRFVSSIIADKAYRIASFLMNERLRKVVFRLCKRPQVGSRCGRRFRP